AAWSYMAVRPGEAHWSCDAANVREALQVRAGGTDGRRTMHKSCNGSGAMPVGFNAVSADELGRIEGGQGSMRWVGPRTVGTIIESFGREANARYQALKEKWLFRVSCG